MATFPEPWLRGPVAALDPLVAPVLYSLLQAREDLTAHTEGLTTAQIWATPYGFGSVGFHIRHTAGSTDRLIAYLEGLELSEPQFQALKNEKEPGASREELLVELDHSFVRAESVVRALNPATLSEPRSVGRQRLPTTVIGLLTHIAEHTQRHVGQVVSAAKLARVIVQS